MDDKFAGVVCIESQNGVSGTGFVVSTSGIIVTCSHVIHNENACAPRPDEVKVVFCNREVQKATVINKLWDPINDIAFLKSEDILPVGVKPMILGSSIGTENHEIETMGYPIDGQYVPISGKGTIYRETTNIFKDEYASVLQIHSVETIEGFSGGPVLDTFTGWVVGMIVRTMPLETAFAIPSERIAEICPKIRCTDIRDAWYNSEVRVKEGLIRDELDHEKVGNYPYANTSPLTDLWDKFITAPCWHENMKQSIDVKKFKQNGFSSAIDNIICTIDDTLDYISIQGRLKNSIKEEIKQIENNINNYQNYSKRNESPEKWIEVCRIHQDFLSYLEALKKDVEDPRFGRCFFVKGGLGSGRTHFISSLMSDTAVKSISCNGELSPIRKNYLILHLDTNKSGTLSELILYALNEDTNMGWNRLEDLDNTLEKINKYLKLDNKSRLKLVITVDDLQKCLSKDKNFVDDLTRTVIRHTKLHNVYWLFTLLDTSYEDILYLKYTDFWKHFSIIDYDAHLNKRYLDDQDLVSETNGWLVLDDFNHMHRIGLELIESRLEHSLDQERWMDDNIQQNFSNPFLAWILVDLLHDSDIKMLINLNYIDFISRFWDKRRKSLIDFYPSDLPSNSKSDRLIGQAVSLLSICLSKMENFASLQDLELLKKNILTYIQTPQKEEKIDIQDRGTLEMLIEILKKGNLIKTCVRRPGYEFSKECIQIKFNMFWEYQLSRNLLENYLNKYCKISGNIFEQIQIPSSIKERQSKIWIFQFILLLMESESYCKRFPANIYEKIWMMAFESHALLSDCIWYAGPKASIKLQEKLQEWAALHYKDDKEPKNLYPYLYFLRGASPAISTANRIKQASPYYKKIYDNGLSSFYKNTVEWIFLKDKENKNILESMPYFQGCEVMNIQKELAQITISTLIINFNNNLYKSIDYLFRYLKDISQRAEIEYVNRYPKRSQRKKGVQWRYFYIEWVLYAFCQRLVKELSPEDAFNFLSENHWYDPESRGLSISISMYMEREANIALGYGYRNSSEEDKVAFIGLINRLVDSGEKKKREQAFHIIRHTVPVDDYRCSLIDEEFLKSLYTIYLDEDLKYLQSKFCNVFSINLRKFSHCGTKK